MVEVSVIVPCYNCEKTIERCIDSIKNQSFKDFEALLIDDGSTDKTSLIINRLIKDDKRFQYYYKENGGLSDARNYGLDRFSGKYISFVDSDDYIEKDFIKLLYQSIQKNNTKLSVCNFNLVFENSKKQYKITKDDIDLNKVVAVWKNLFHKSLFIEENLRFPYGKWYEDLCVISKIIFTIGEDYSIVNKPLYNYVQYEDSIMHTSDDRIFQIYDILDDITLYCKKKGIYENVEKKIEFMWIHHVLFGTIFRLAFYEKFSKKMIKNIKQKVTKLYPNWKKNKYIKKQSFIVKIHITLLKYNQITIIYFLIRYPYRYIQKRKIIN